MATTETAANDGVSMLANESWAERVMLPLCVFIIYLFISMHVFHQLFEKHKLPNLKEIFHHPTIYTLHVGTLMTV